MKMDILQNRRRARGKGAALAMGLAALAGIGAVAAAGSPAAVRAAAAAAQSRGAAAPVAAVPSNVLVFPAEVPGANATGTAANEPAARSARDVQEIVTDAVRSKMSRAGVGLFVYSRRLPSVQRAVAEGLKAEEAAGPGDDDARARRLAEIVGATEFVVLSVENYRYDPATRTATFSRSALRRSAEDGAPLGTVSESATGVSPEDIAAPRQEGAAVARAADVVAEQVVGGLFPLPKVATDPKKK
jgi:hypothetical protein